MLLYIFLIVSSIMIIKPVCSALFLSEFGADQLPYVFILVAIFAAIVSSIYSRLLLRIRLDILIIRTLWAAINSLFLFWILIFTGFLIQWAIYIFYVWVAIFAVISASQFWVFANFVFSAREAKRLFGIVGSGAIAGGIFGGYLTSILAPFVGSTHLLFVCILFLVLCIMIIRNVWHFNQGNLKYSDILQHKNSDKISESPMRLIKKSKHLTLLAMVVGITVLVAKLVEYQFSAIATANIADEDELAAFFGFWLSNLNIASLVIQLLLTPRVVGVFGVGSSLFFLPVSIFISALAILIHPALWSAILIKMSDGSLKNSLNKAGLELLAIPIPTEIKNRAKTFIDVFVDSFSTGISGFLLFLFTLLLGFSTRQVSFIIIALVGVWIYLVFRVRKEYIQSFRLKIERKKLTEILPTPEIKSESILGGIIEVLEGKNETQIIQVLKMTREVQNVHLIPSLKKLIHHSSSEIRLEVLRNIYPYKDNSLIKIAKILSLKDDHEIKIEAIAYLFQHAGEQDIQVIEGYLDHSDIAVQVAALVSAARECRNNQGLKSRLKIKNRTVTFLKNLSNVSDKGNADFIKINCARVIGFADIPALYPYLHILMNDRSPAVVKMAIQAAGLSQATEFLSPLINFLKNNQFQEVAAVSIKLFKTKAIEELLAYLEKPEQDRTVRIKIPAIIAAIGIQKSVSVLLQKLEYQDLEIRHEIINALYQMRLSHPTLKFDEGKIVRRILEEATMCMETLGVLYFQMRTFYNSKHENRPLSQLTNVELARRQLIKSLEQRLDHNLERIFLLLGLKYPPEDIHNAYQSLHSKKPDIRENAIDFLDNLLESNLKKAIIPVVEKALLESISGETKKEIDSRLRTEFECLTLILSGGDLLLKEKALILIGYTEDEIYLPYICQYLNSSHPKLKKAARLALKNMGILDMISIRRNI